MSQASEINERTAEVEELNDILRHLDNGSVADPAWQGKALRFMLRRFRYLMVRETVNEADCLRRRQEMHAACLARMEACPGKSLFTRPKETVFSEVMKLAGWLGFVVYLAYQLSQK